MRFISGLLLFAISIPNTALAQQTDSLLAVLDTARNERKVKTLNELFKAHINIDPVTAIGYAREALTLGTEIEDQRGIAAAYNNIGVAYRNQGALDKALTYYINSLKIYETLENKEGIASTKNNISTIYSIKGDYANALKYLEESNKLLTEIGDQQKLVGSLNNLGNLNNNLQLYDKALNYFLESYKLSEKLGQPFSDALSNVGNVYFRQNNFQRAIEHYQKALELERKLNNKLGMLNTLSNIGIAYTKANQPVQAQHYLNEAYMLALDIGVNAEIPEILKNSSFNYYRQGKLDEAYELLLQYDSAREVIYGLESTKRIAQMEMALELSDKEREYEALKKTAEVKTLELKNTRLFIVLIILAVILVAGVLNFYLADKLKQVFKK